VRVFPFIGKVLAGIGEAEEQLEEQLIDPK
jgi:hypothetical protein